MLVCLLRSCGCDTLENVQGLWWWNSFSRWFK